MSEMKVLANKILGWSQDDNPDYNKAFRLAIESLRLKAKEIEIDKTGWYDIDGTIDDKPLGLVLKKELRYLTLKKVLQWHPEKPNLVRIVGVLA